MLHGCVQERGSSAVAGTGCRVPHSWASLSLSSPCLDAVTSQLRDPPGPSSALSPPVAPRLPGLGISGSSTQAQPRRTSIARLFKHGVKKGTRAEFPQGDHGWAS